MDLARDTFPAVTGELTADRGEGGTHLPGDAMAAVLAAVVAALEPDAPAATARYPGGMPVWKRAGLAELMRHETGLRDF